MYLVKLAAALALLNRGVRYQAYLAKKNTWLAANPTVRPAQSRTKRGLRKLTKAICDSQKWKLPRQRITVGDSGEHRACPLLTRLRFADCHFLHGQNVCLIDIKLAQNNSAVY
jgi:hypothetical protein